MTPPHPSSKVSLMLRCTFSPPARTVALSERLIAARPLLNTLGSIICLDACRCSESSSQALSVFNKAGLLDVVVQCLERHPQNVELAISAGTSL